MSSITDLPASDAPRPIAVIDMGASAIRLVVAEVPREGGEPKVIEEASRGVLLGKDTFSHGKLSAATMEATLKALAGFRRIMDSFGVESYRAVATSALREADNCDTFVDRIRLRTGLEVEVIDGSEENRLTYVAVRATLRSHEGLTAGDALLVEVGGGSADISFLRKGEPIHSGIYALGSIRLRQSLASWHGGHEHKMRLLRRHIHNVVEDIRREMPLKDARAFIALGHHVRFAGTRILGEGAPASGPLILPKTPFLAFCDQVAADDVEQLMERDRLSQAEAETFVPALLAYRELLVETGAEEILVPEASLSAGLLLELTREEKGAGVEDFRRQVLASATALGEKYRYDVPHARQVAFLATRLFDEMRAEHGLTDRHRLLLEVAALLHDIGIYVNLKGHHKHTEYLLSVSEIFSLSRDDMAIIANVARYHRRATPQKSHLPYMALDRETRVEVNKMAAILRVANALDADHLQKIKDLRLLNDEGALVIEVQGAGDLTMERLACLARGDFLTEVFGHRLAFRESGMPGVTTAKTRKKEPELFFNRELSWLAFNHRVLEEAMDKETRLLERLKFATIVSGNLDEFFMVRVAALKHDQEEGEVGPDSAGLTPAQQLTAIAQRAHEMVERLHKTLMEEILPGLVPHGIRIAPVAELDPTQRALLSRHFRDEVQPALTPLAIDQSRPFPHLASLSLNVGVLLAPAGEGEPPRLAVVQVPGRLPRLVRPIGGDGTLYVLLEDVIRAELGTLFPGQTVIESTVFRVTRDAEMELDDEGTEGDYLEVLEEELRKRRRSRTVRLELDAGVSDTLLAMLSARLDVGNDDVYRIAGLLDLRALGSLVELPALEPLRDPPLRPVQVLDAPELENIFDVLDQRDVLLHHPYESFDPVVSFVSRAADDPDVLAIKQTLYRTSGQSPIVQALARAADQGRKQVTVLVELMARFDERSNIRWARSLEESGAHVIYGIRGYKTHAKICLVVRRGRQGIRRYVHLGTGNYNDKTARLYTDFGLMTADPDIGEDASAFFNALTGYSDPPRMKKLFMAPTMLRERVLRLIERERRRAESGQAAEIRAKLNSLADEDVIRALYDASKAGVKIRLNVRGICGLRPCVKGVSETIEVVSIVDRFLEHSRIFYFRNGGDEEVYLSSADWMPRNLDRRIELMFPIESVEARQKVMQALDCMFLDNVKSRWLQSDGNYKRRRAKGDDPFRVQMHLHREAVRAVERARAAEGVTFEPLDGGGHS